MSAAKSKVELSLDEIIKTNKKEQKGGNRNVRRGAGNKAGVRRKGQGVLKRRSVGAQKNRAVLKRSNATNGNQAAGASSTINKVATQRLVNKLVKKALKQVTVARAPKIGAVRNVIRGRRGGVRNRGQQRNIALNRVSQRSRVIGRRSRIVNRSPVVSLSNRPRGGGRGNRRRGNRIAQVVAARSEPNPIRAQLNFLRRQQQRNPTRQQVVQVPVIRQQQQQRRSFPVQRRQATRVIYVQEQRPPPVRRQPQQIVYVQQPRRQFSRGGRRPQRRNDSNPFYEPPNFLQRIPTQSYGRGRGGRFVEY